ncbi:hypothetical protein EVAR_86978_1 [Eumeta japonica]|uniref:Uncharacterized protein n=1 Tax=Eumeta variegata TaxID=151549 RepID=A0A4C1W9B7_EUMVA|nr:hypothetical protein EVAR_86978_1 [Eumeta japonica]
MTRRPKPPPKLGAYALSASKRSSPANAAYPGSVITASPTGIRPATAFIQRVKAWRPRQHAHAIRTQTVHPPVSHANKRPHGQLPDARGLQKSPTAREGCARRAPARAVSATLLMAAGPRNAPPAAKIPQHPQQTI